MARFFFTLGLLALLSDSTGYAAGKCFTAWLLCLPGWLVVGPTGPTKRITWL